MKHSLMAFCGLKRTMLEMKRGFSLHALWLLWNEKIQQEVFSIHKYNQKYPTHFWSSVYYIYTYNMSIYECIKFCFWKETHLRSRCMYLTLQNVSWLLKRQNVVIIFVWMPYIGVRTYFHSNYIQQFQIQHKIFCSFFHLPSCLFQLSEMVYLMHREIMESRIPSNYFYIPFVYICFIYVDQRTRISVQRYCNNRMYILVKEYRIIFWVMQVLFTHVR